jgi:MOSC domain-containing protein YiiM
MKITKGTKKERWYRLGASVKNPYMEDFSHSKFVSATQSLQTMRRARLLVMGEIVAVCVSEKKGTAKKNIGECRFIENFGLENDAHAGNWHRQVSLLSYEEVEKFRARGANVADGAFGENLLVKGFDFKTYPVGTIFKCNDVVLEITQIGKKCHSECEIFHMVGDCIMPREGVFAKVLKGGIIKVGDELVLVSNK